jgi:GGDEF domain-containing protein
MSADLALAVLPAVAVVLLLAVHRRRGQKSLLALEQNQLDLDAVILANVELHNVGEARDAAQHIARVATELLVADGAIVWIQGPGGLLCAGGHGITPDPEHEPIQSFGIEQVLRTGSVSDEDGDIAVPLTASGGVFGVVTVHAPMRRASSFVSSVLEIFGAQAGQALERLRAVESLIDAEFVDPITGVGTRAAATVALATLHAGDAVLLLAVEELEALRAAEGDERADLALAQLGMHLRTGTRVGDLVARFDDDVFFILLRELYGSAEEIVDRLLTSWQSTLTIGRLRVGAALHSAETLPSNTLELATSALGTARARLDSTSQKAA